MKKIFFYVVFSLYFVISNCCADFNTALKLFESEKYQESAPLFFECHENGNILAYNYLKCLYQKGFFADFKPSSTLEELGTKLSAAYLQASQYYIDYIKKQNKAKPIVSLQALAKSNNSHAIMLLGEIAEIEQQKPLNQRTKLKKTPLKKPIDYYIDAARLYDREGFLALKRINPEHSFVKTAFILEKLPEGAGEEKLAHFFFAKNNFSEWAQWFLRAYFYGKRINTNLLIDSIASNLIKNAVNRVQRDILSYEFKLPFETNLLIINVIHFLAHEEDPEAQNFIAALHDPNFKELINDHYSKNAQNAHYWYTKAAFNGDNLACFNSGFMSFKKCQKLDVFQKKLIDKHLDEIKNALNFLKKTALENYDESLSILLAFHEEIYLIAKDDRFIDEYMDALKMGYEQPNENQLSYAIRYIDFKTKYESTDNVTEQELDVFTQKFSKNEHILNQVGVIYKDGLCGIQKSDEHSKKAITYFEKCIEIDPNYRDALYNLGHILLRSAPLNIDTLLRIVDLSQRAYNLGEIDAAFDLGIAHFKLRELGCDFAPPLESIKWLNCSANDHNNSKAQFNLALLHIQGDSNLAQDINVITDYLDRAIVQNDVQAIALKIFMLLFLDYNCYQDEIRELRQLANKINFNWLSEIDFVLPLFSAFTKLGVDDAESEFSEITDEFSEDTKNNNDGDSEIEDDLLQQTPSSNPIQISSQLDYKTKQCSNQKQKNIIKNTNKKNLPNKESVIKLKKKESEVLNNIMDKKSRKKVRWDEFVKLTQRYMKPGDSITRTKHKGSKVKFDIEGQKLDLDVPEHDERAILKGRRLEKVREFFNNLRK